MLRARELSRLKDTLLALYQTHTGQPLDKIGERRPPPPSIPPSFPSPSGPAAAAAAAESFSPLHSAPNSVARPPARPPSLLPTESTLDRDCYMSAPEARSWGLVDEIVKNRPAEEVIREDNAFPGGAGDDKGAP